MNSTFSAIVTIEGDAANGDMTINIVQVEAPERPDRPPIEPPSPPVSPPESPPPPPNGGNGGTWTPPDYLRTDTNKVSVPNVGKPAYLTPFTDPNFKTKIIRISGNPGSNIEGINGGHWGDECRHHYNSDQAWSCDQKLIYLDTNNGGAPGDLFLDGETYHPLFGGNNKPSSADIRWHPKTPGIMLCASKSKLIEWNPKTGEQTTIGSFSGFDDLTFGPWEGSPSQDGNRVVLTSDSKRQFFAYDIKAGKKYPTLEGSAWGDFSDARISRGGQYIVLKCGPDEVFILTLEGNDVTHLPNNYVSHFDVGIDAAGDEVLCGRVNSSSVGQGGSGLVSKYRLKDGKRTGLQSAKGWSSHTSCRSNLPYAVAGPTLEGGDYVYNGELILCDMNGGRVYRLGHTHTNNEVEYVQETQPVHSPDGGRVMFASPWGSSSGVGCYVVDFRK